MRILLAIDGSDYSAGAVEEIVGRHFAADSEVCLLSVVETPGFFPITTSWEALDMTVYQEALERAHKEADAAVEKAAARLRSHDDSQHLSVTTKVLSGSPKHVILEEAEAFGADLIIVGSHGQSALEDFLLGSVSHAVALHARCSVELVRSPKTQPGVTLDHSG